MKRKMVTLWVALIEGRDASKIIVYVNKNIFRNTAYVHDHLNQWEQIKYQRVNPSSLVPTCNVNKSYNSQLKNSRNSSNLKGNYLTHTVSSKIKVKE